MCDLDQTGMTCRWCVVLKSHVKVNINIRSKILMRPLFVSVVGRERATPTAGNADPNSVRHTTRCNRPVQISLMEVYDTEDRLKHEEHGTVMIEQLHTRHHTYLVRHHTYPARHHTSQPVPALTRIPVASVVVVFIFLVRVFVVFILRVVWGHGAGGGGAASVGGCVREGVSVG